MVSPLTMNNESISLDMNFFNLPLGSGEPISQSVSGYLDIIIYAINQSQRRTKLMRDVGKEIQLRFI